MSAETNSIYVGFDPAKGTIKLTGWKVNRWELIGEYAQNDPIILEIICSKLGIPKPKLELPDTSGIIDLGDPKDDDTANSSNV